MIQQKKKMSNRPTPPPPPRPPTRPHTPAEGDTPPSSTGTGQNRTPFSRSQSLSAGRPSPVSQSSYLTVGRRPAEVPSPFSRSQSLSAGRPLPVSRTPSLPAGLFSSSEILSPSLSAGPAVSIPWSHLSSDSIKNSRVKEKVVLSPSQIPTPTPPRVPSQSSSSSSLDPREAQRQKRTQKKRIVLQSTPTPPPEEPKEEFKPFTPSQEEESGGFVPFEEEVEVEERPRPRRTISFVACEWRRLVIRREDTPMSFAFHDAGGWDPNASLVSATSSAKMIGAKVVKDVVAQPKPSLLYTLMTNTTRPVTDMDVATTRRLASFCRLAETLGGYAYFDQRSDIDTARMRIAAKQVLNMPTPKKLEQTQRIILVDIMRQCLDKN